MQSSLPEARKGFNGSLTRLGLVADDLTGSNDTGVQFAKQGLGTLVILELAGVDAAIEGAAGYDVLVINTDSRADDPAKACSKARQGAKALLDAGIEYIYKKTLHFAGQLGSRAEGPWMPRSRGGSLHPALPALGGQCRRLPSSEAFPSVKQRSPDRSSRQMSPTFPLAGRPVSVPGGAYTLGTLAGSKKSRRPLATDKPARPSSSSTRPRRSISQSPPKLSSTWTWPEDSACRFGEILPGCWALVRKSTEDCPF